MAIIIAEGKQSYTNDAGVPLAGGRLYTYDAGTTTPRLTWSDSAQTAPHTNPIILDARGEATVFWSGAYKVELRTATDVPIWTVDNITASGDPISAATLAASGGSALIGYQFPATGSVVRTVYSKLNDQCYYVEDFGADGTLAGDSAALKAAIIAATATWAPVILPARRFFWDGTAITENKVRIWGRGMPTPNAGKTAMVGGSIIEGALVCVGAYIDLRDFGVDLGTSGAGPDNNGIKCTASPYNAGEYLHTENISALCKNKVSAFHALLFEGYKKHTGTNLYGANGFFNCVIKNRVVQLGYVDCDTANETGLYIKSDTTYGSVSDVQIGSVRTRGADQFGVRVQSDSANIDNVQFGRIHGSDHQRTVCVQVLSSGTQISRVNLGNVISERASIADVSFLQQKAGGAMFSVGLESLETKDTVLQVVETSAPVGYPITHLYATRIFASYVAGATQPTMDNAIFVDAAVNSTNFQNVEIVENYGVGAKIGAINYINVANPKADILGTRRVKTVGVGVPRPGVLSQVLAGATATLQIPFNDAAAGKSIGQVSIAAPTTITIFTPELAGNVFSIGDLLYVMNSNASALTVANNPAGGIINQGGAAVVLAPNEVAAWMHIGGGSWSEVKIA